MRATPLVALVAGVFVLQQQSVLPGNGVLAILAGVAGLGLLLGWRLQRGDAARPSMVIAVHAGTAATLGFLWAAHTAHLRLADELSFADEGKDVVVIGVVSSLPAELERGTRFEFDVEHVETKDVLVPAHISLAWYGASAAVRPAERWQFTVRLKRPHGVLNPGGFDFEAWMIERNLRASGYVRDGNTGGWAASAGSFRLGRWRADRSCQSSATSAPAAASSGRAFRRCADCAHPRRSAGDPRRGLVALQSHRHFAPRVDLRAAHRDDRGIGGARGKRCMASIASASDAGGDGDSCAAAACR
jgi:hypothetical protein